LFRNITKNKDKKFLSDKSIIFDIYILEKKTAEIQNYFLERKRKNVEKF